MNDDVTWFRADRRGLERGQTLSRAQLYGDGQDYIFATNRRDVARAYAAQRPDWSVYEVKPIGSGHTYHDECLAGTHMFDFAVVLDLAEETVTTPREEAWKPIAEQFRWLDGSARYDDEGYATAPPGMRGDTAPEKTLRARLREMGKYLPPDEVEGLVCATLTTAGPKPWTT